MNLSLKLLSILELSHQNGGHIMCPEYLINSQSMKYLKKTLLFIYAIYGLLLFTLIMVVLFPFILIISFLGRGGYVLSFYMVKLWALLYAIFSLVVVRIKRSKKIKKGQSYIFVCNHTSFLDAIVTPLAIPGAVRPLGKKELKKFPLLGIVIGRFGVFVDRKDQASRKESLGNMSKVAESGDNVLIFPEGTTNRTGKPLQDFYDGAFKIAKETNLDIVPMVVLNAANLLPPSKISLRPGVVYVEVGDPISCKNHTVKELKEISRNWILSRVVGEVKFNSKES
ncbi:MAG: 1-acyl-sn-glycerol-3-phosphate acyltransferase [Cyclobacteriaceae bacterium]|nr:1-acyl-sn-glycerol-3-phosphate acyltransferase [Cyclobacteriaceae bacterium]